MRRRLAGETVLARVADMLPDLPIDPLREDELLAMAAAVKYNSADLLAGALAPAARERDLVIQRICDFQSTPGSGLVGIVKGRSASIGNLESLVLPYWSYR
jgi:cation transport ATPase